jgi:uncharacterized protein YjbI with pentapeptide repeats
MPRYCGRKWLTESLAKLREGVAAWNRWRLCAPNVTPDLSGADLRKVEMFKLDPPKKIIRTSRITTNKTGGQSVNFSRANLRGANLEGTNLQGASLRFADLREADLRRADLWMAELYGSNLSGADLSNASLDEANLRGVNANGALLRSARLNSANLFNASVSGVDARGASLIEANLSLACFSGSDLRHADLRGAYIVKGNFEKADISECRVYGVAAWDVNLKECIQSDLDITSLDDAETILVDDLEVAQFLHLLLTNSKIRSVIDTVTAKVVLLLGRFTPPRKAVLDALKAELRKFGYVPVLFDFSGPSSKDTTGTVETLARMARFVIADVTDPASVPHELATLVPFLRTTPVQLVIHKGSSPYSMAADFKRYPWVLNIVVYKDEPSLISRLNTLLANLEKRALKLRKRK